MLETTQNNRIEDNLVVYTLLNSIFAELIAFKMMEDDVQIVPLEGVDFPVITSARREEIIH